MEISLGLRKGAWTAEEDLLLRECIEKYGEGKWCHVPLRSGLKRCRKSCRLRWLNYLRPNIKRGQFTVDEMDLIHRLHKLLGNRWSLIAGRLPGRTANDVKNYWNTHMQKKLASLREEVKATTQETEEKKVIKPRPRIFSKNSRWLRRETTSVDTNQPGDIFAMSSTKFPPGDDTQWWEDVLFGKEGEKGTSCSIVGSGDEFPTSFWVEQMEETTKGGDTFLEEGKSTTDWDDFFLDVNLWG